ncbi:quercetin dioxygenase-like cupin family protein [Nocardiopsis mwathae]|uniref:Quercetin dioxygenase-like cupin family protein n=1 Tax=Nocardiopsis mwathae TaxID=1472723 RepID=A0A7X0D4F7_9ACTN|nr:LuxR family transcriptional regulator [Nocardiopsis mwathae]MBB6171050.1 quercetin dioxygenase-like cupin family protein [Nocardiopsis mwathae]
MLKLSLDALARKHLDTAARSSAGRSAETFYGGHEHVLRQTLIALMRGNSLSGHETPGESTLYVLNGRVRLTSDTDMWEARTGDVLILPSAEHAIEALEESVVVLTVAMPKTDEGTWAQE